MKNSATLKWASRCIAALAVLMFVLSASELQAQTPALLSGSELSIGTGTSFWRSGDCGAGIGGWNEVGVNCVAIGEENTWYASPGEDSLTVGVYNQNDADDSFILGGGNTVPMATSIGVFGGNNWVCAGESLIVGSANSTGAVDYDGNNNYGPAYSAIVGRYHSAGNVTDCFISGENNVVGGNLLVPEVNDSVAMGSGLIVTSSVHVAVGQYNTQYSSGTEPLFTVGCGTSSTDRHDALVVKKDGSTTVNGTLTVSGTMVNGKVVASGSNTLLIPEQGDLSMGGFTSGPQPSN